MSGLRVVKQYARSQYVVYCAARKGVVVMRKDTSMNENTRRIIATMEAHPEGLRYAQINLYAGTKLSYSSIARIIRTESERLGVKVSKARPGFRKPIVVYWGTVPPLKAAVARKSAQPTPRGIKARVLQIEQEIEQERGRTQQKHIHWQHLLADIRSMF